MLSWILYGAYLRLAWPGFVALLPWPFSTRQPMFSTSIAKQLPEFSRPLACQQCIWLRGLLGCDWTHPVNTSLLCKCCRDMLVDHWFVPHMQVSGAKEYRLQVIRGDPLQILHNSPLQNSILLDFHIQGSMTYKDFQQANLKYKK